MKGVELFRKKLLAKEQLVGGAITMKDLMATELITRSMDFVWIDMEHGGLSIDNVEQHILAAKKNGKTALVRVPKLDMAWIKQVLDCGAHGVIVPQLYTPDEVREAVSYTRYYPKGKRGFGPRIPYTYGTMGSVKDYLEWANSNIFLGVQIETKEAYEHLDEILSIDGYDSIVIGPADFALNCGYDADIGHPEVITMLSDIIKRVHRAEKYVGFGMAVNVEYAQKILQMGVDWLQVGSDFDYISKVSADITKYLKG